MTEIRPARGSDGANVRVHAMVRIEHAQAVGSDHAHAVGAAELHQLLLRFRAFGADFAKARRDDDDRIWPRSDAALNGAL